MLGAAGVHDHAVQGAGLGDDAVDGLGDGGLLGHVGLDGEEAVRVALGQGGELVAGGVGDVKRVDASGAVVQAALGDAEADAAVGAGDCLFLVVVLKEGCKWGVWVKVWIGGGDDEGSDGWW